MAHKKVNHLIRKQHHLERETKVSGQRVSLINSLYVASGKLPKELCSSNLSIYIRCPYAAHLLAIYLLLLVFLFILRLLYLR